MSMMPWWLTDLIVQPIRLPSYWYPKTNDGPFFDPRVKAFLNNMAVYPLGSLLELNTGELCIVIDINRKSPAQPVVRMLYDRNWKLLTPYELDLSKNPSYLVKNVLSERQIRELKKNV